MWVPQVSFLATFSILKAAANLSVGAAVGRIGRKWACTLGWAVGLVVPALLLLAAPGRAGWPSVLAASGALGLQQGLCWTSLLLITLDLMTRHQAGLATGLNETVGYTAVALFAHVYGALEHMYVRCGWSGGPGSTSVGGSGGGAAAAAAAAVAAQGVESEGAAAAGPLQGPLLPSYACLAASNGTCSVDPDAWAAECAGWCVCGGYTNVMAAGAAAVVLAGLALSALCLSNTRQAARRHHGGSRDRGTSARGRGNSKYQRLSTTDDTGVHAIAGVAGGRGPSTTAASGAPGAGAEQGRGRRPSWSSLSFSSDEGLAGGGGGGGGPGAPGELPRWSNVELHPELEGPAGGVMMVTYEAEAHQRHHHHHHHHGSSQVSGQPGEATARTGPSPWALTAVAAPKPQVGGTASSSSPLSWTTPFQGWAAGDAAPMAVEVDRGASMALGAGGADVGVAGTPFDATDCQRAGAAGAARAHEACVQATFWGVFWRCTLGRSTGLICLAGFVTNALTGVAWGLMLGWARDVLRLPGPARNMLMSTYSLLKGPPQLLFGAVSDRVGRQWLVALGLAANAAGLATAALGAGFRTSVGAAAVAAAADIGDVDVEVPGAGALDAAAATATASVVGGGVMAAVMAEFGALVLAACLMGGGTGIMYPALQAAVVDHSSNSTQAVSLATYRFWRDLGYSGGVLGGLLADWLGAEAALLLFAGVACATAVAVALGYEERLGGCASGSLGPAESAQAEPATAGGSAQGPGPLGEAKGRKAAEDNGRLVHSGPTAGVRSSVELSC